MPKPPTETLVVEPTLSRSITEWTPALIRAARISADAGDLTLAADFWEWALGDDRVSASVATRTNGLVSLPLTFESARGTKRLVKALEAQEDWWAAYPASTLAQLLAWGRGLGVGLAHQTWVERGDGITRLIPQIKIWHPRHLRRDMQRGVWRVLTANRGEIDITPGDGNWILFTPYGETRPWTFGAWRAISYWRLLKQYAIEDWGFYSGKNAGGWNVASFTGTDPKLATKEARKELAAAMFEAQANASLAIPPGYDIKKVEATASTYQTYEAQKNAADLGSCVTILGQNLSTEVTGPVSTGATLHGKVIQVYVSDDNEKLHTCVRDQSLRYWSEFNFGNGSLAPWASYDITAPENAKAKAEVAKTQSDTARTLASIGVFTVNEVREAAGKEPLKEGGDEIMKPAPPPAPEDQNKQDDGANKPPEDAKRVLIAGGPRTGKTTLAREVGGSVRHTDDLIPTHEWSAASDEVASWFDEPGPWLIEGVAIARALRKWLATRSGTPADVVHVSHEPKVGLTEGQRVMLEGCRKVWLEIEGELVARGVVIETF